MRQASKKISLLNLGLLLEYVTIAWNVVGTIIVVVAAIKARSVALVSFDLDSLIEIFVDIGKPAPI